MIDCCMFIGFMVGGVFGAWIGKKLYRWRHPMEREQ